MVMTCPQYKVERMAQLQTDPLVFLVTVTPHYYCHRVRESQSVTSGGVSDSSSTEGFLNTGPLPQALGFSPDKILPILNLYAPHKIASKICKSLSQLHSLSELSIGQADQTGKMEIFFKQLLNILIALSGM